MGAAAAAVVDLFAISNGADLFNRQHDPLALAAPLMRIEIRNVVDGKERVEEYEEPAEEGYLEKIVHKPPFCL